MTCTPGPLCLAPGGEGVLVSTDPLGGDTWTAREIDGQNRLSGIACPSRQWCLAVDDAGNAVTLGPSGFSNARINPAIPVGAPIVLPQAVACPSASLCVAVGGFGDVLASRDPTAGPTAWSRFSYGSNHGLGAVSCPTTSFCAALGYFGDVATTTNPSGGATAWTITSIVPQCRVGSCGDLTSLACPSPTLCVAASDQGKLFVSRNPIGGARTWRAFRLWNPRKYVSDAIALACPSIALCVGADFQGHIFTSINPARGPAAWRVTGLGATHPLGGISCPFISLCVAPALDSSDLPTNTVYISRNPTGGRSAWSTQQIPMQLGALACATRTRCLGIGGENISTASVQPISIAREIRPRLRQDLAPPKTQDLIACLLRRTGCRYTARAPTAGTLTVSWYVNRSLIARGATTFNLAGTSPITLKLTRRGRRLLSHRHGLSLSAAGSFTPIATAALHARRTLTTSHSTT